MDEVRPHPIWVRPLLICWGHDLAALEASGQRDSGKEHFKGKAVPIRLTTYRSKGHIHACAVEALIANGGGVE